MIMLWYPLNVLSVLYGWSAGAEGDAPPEISNALHPPPPTKKHERHKIKNKK